MDTWTVCGLYFTSVKDLKFLKFAHSYLSRCLHMATATRPSAVYIRNPLTYKTELCKNINCRFGDCCEFAHGVGELRTMPLSVLENEGRIPSEEKYRQFPCRSFVMTGSCPYNHRCVFLHDPRLKGPETDAASRPVVRAKEDMSKDAFYWPDMHPYDVRLETDERGLPVVDQCYLIPFEFGSKHATKHDQAVFSMYNHFAVALSGKATEDRLTNNETNVFLNKKRLPFFCDLANSTTPQETRPKTASTNKPRKQLYMPVDEEHKHVDTQDISPRDTWSGFVETYWG